jgi:hypothetical protein
MKKLNKAQQIRNYMEKHPTANTAKICSALGVEPSYIYAVRNKMKTAADKANDDATKSVLKNFAERAYKAGAGRSSPPQVGDNVGGLILTDVGNGELRWIAKPKIRMQSVENRGWQPPELLPTPEVPEVPTVDNVNHPPHYKTGGMETIDFIEAKELNYHLGNVIKYVSRAKHKGNELEDLKKAQWYLERAIMKIHV